MGRHTVDLLQLCIKRQKRRDCTPQMEATTTASRQPQRAIVHRGWLQQKMYRNGTLLKKKKIFFENELFVVLSVHNVSNGGCIPRLEWFAEQCAIFERRPLKSQDLTDCQCVNVAIGDERCFSIGFVDGSAPVLELLAPSIEERVQWVRTLRSTLRRLNLLNNENNGEEQHEDSDGVAPWPRPTNEYVVLAARTHSDDDNDGDKPSTSYHPVQPPLARIRDSPNDRRAVPQSPRVPLSPIPSSQAFPQQSMAATRDVMPLIRQHSAQQQILSTHLNDDETVQKADAKKRTSASCEQLSPPPSSPVHFDGKGEKNDSDSVDRIDSLPPPLPPRTPRHKTAAQCSTADDALSALPPPQLPNSPIPLSQSLKSQYEILSPASPSPPPLRSQYDQLPAPSNNGRSRLSSQCVPPQLYGSFDGPTGGVSSDDVVVPSFPKVPPSVVVGQPTTELAHYDVLCAAAPSVQYDVLSNVSPSSSLAFSSQRCTMTERIFRDALSRSRRLFFSFTLLTEHIAFVELFDKVWVAGWTSAVDLHLREHGFTLNCGDQVERIDGDEVRNLQMLPNIYQRIMPGAQVPLMLRSNPTMMVFTLVRPENPRLNLGIKFNRGTKFLLRQPFDCLTIDSIVPKSLAHKTHLPATVPAYLHQPIAHSPSKSRQQKQPFHVSSPSSPNLLPSGSDRAVITHLDGVPLNPFGPRDQFLRHLDTIPVGQSFNITLHSADFCSRLARQMKNQLGNKWRHFVHGE